MADSRDYNISVLDYALRALEVLLVAEPAGMSLQTIAGRLGVTKSRAFRILSTLQSQGFVVQDEETRGYRLGLKLLSFGEKVRHQLQLPQVAAPALDDLATASGETVFLGVIDGSEVVCIDKRESAYPVRLYAEIGRRAPLHAGGVPRVLLAYRLEEYPALLDRLTLQPLTAGTITDRAVLLDDLARIRRQGYVIAVDDLDMGATSVAAPIRDHRGQVIAALSVAGPNERLTADRVQMYVALVCAAAARISAAMGFQRMAARANAPPSYDPR